MARGKNKAVAERRKAALVEIGSIDSLRLQIKNLKEELEETKQSAALSDALKKDNIAELNRKLKENTSAEVEELKETVNSLRKDLGDLREQHEKMLKKWHKASEYLIGHYEVEHRLPRHEAAALLLPVISPDWEGEPPTVADSDLVAKANAGKLTSAQIKLLQRKRAGY